RDAAVGGAQRNPIRTDRRELDVDAPIGRRGVNAPAQALAGDAAVGGMCPDLAADVADHNEAVGIGRVDDRTLWRADVIAHFERRPEHDAAHAPGFHRHAIGADVFLDLDARQQFLGGGIGHPSGDPLGADFHRVAVDALDLDLAVGIADADLA